MLTRQSVQSIRDLHSKPGRDASNAFIAEGPKAVDEFLQSSLTPIAVYATAKWLDENAHSLNRYTEFIEVGEKDLQRITSLKTANQVLGVFQKPKADITAFDSQTHLCLALDEIQDPGNIGTIIRCADWFGIRFIFCSPGCADPFAPKVVQATMGSLARVTTLSVDLLNFLDQQKSATIYAATLEGSNIYEFTDRSAGILLIGNEARGLSHELQDRANQTITIPPLGQAESLNAGVATGIILSWLTAPGR